MAISDPKVILEFSKDGDYLKYVDEWSSGLAIYVNGKEIGRSRQFFSIPFISVLNIRGSFINQQGENVNVRVSTPNTPIIRTTTVYFDEVKVFKKKGV
jgi:hypothetical protein